MSLLDILGNYYDSAANTFTTVKDEVSINIEFEMKSMQGASMNYSVMAIGENLTVSMNDFMHYGKPDALKIVNRFVDNFVVNGILPRDFREREYFDYEIRMPDNSTINRVNTTQCLYTEHLMDWMESRNAIPKKFRLNLRLKRQNNDTVRQKASETATGGLHPKDYFAKIINCSFDSSQEPSCKRSVQRAFQRNTVKSYILKKWTKEEAIFLSEYLYGVQVPKTATYAEFFKRLANRPQSDFGIKDVQVLKKFITVISGHIDPITTTNDLLVLGVKPCTDLKRWYKKNSGLEEIVEKLA